MSDQVLQPAAAPPQTPALSQWQRVTNVFAAPSKTFTDIRDHSRSWWLPFVITLATGAILYAAITSKVTWKTVYENQQREAPEFAKRMMENMPPEQRAIADSKGPTNQAVTWALSPLGLLLIDMLAAVVLWPTINFGFGGKATFGAILAVTLYAGLVLWPIKLLLGAAALLAGVAPEAFSPQNVAGTNIAYYLNQSETPAALYALGRYIDPIIIWNLVVTSIGVSVVAGTKRGSGYIAVFGWWILLLIVGVGFAAAFA